MFIFDQIFLHPQPVVGSANKRIKGAQWDETFSILSILKILFMLSYVAYWS